MPVPQSTLDCTGLVWAMGEGDGGEGRGRIGIAIVVGFHAVRQFLCKYIAHAHQICHRSCLSSTKRASEMPAYAGSTHAAAEHT